METIFMQAKPEDKLASYLTDGTSSLKSQQIQEDDGSEVRMFIKTEDQFDDGSETRF